LRPATQLIEQGIKAYTRGQLDEAERLWGEALALEPLNDRAKAYLDLLRGSPGGLAQPVPVPAVPVAAPAAAEGDGSAVALPAPRPEPRSGDRTTLSEYAPSPWDLGPAEAASIVLDGEGGLDLATIDEKSDLKPLVPDQGQPAPTPLPAKPVSDVDVWVQGAKELHALGDFSGSLEMIEKILKVNPSHAEARAYLRQNEATLIAMYESKLGSMSRIPRLAIKPEEVLWLNLDHRAGFLLAQIDGSVNYEDLFALSGLPRLDTARILATLLAEGVITS
jgi:tetratricopeptide (TPR) repeat protein